ncbi:outer membrane protein assembly factor BamB [Acinetobacter sp. TGL-Y2]|uniref:outer membrane protein assembly factor BamB n=1 Tax=Acinetobacter sp. TGL-Y2 TaxID=1407071 RepID=UPI0007A67901|nr:outer membrane protein assembly factor BamB [Acinetobacter sp. TGL-Y2]AMW79799.1 outer membrane protein assembly factor BamB [Acinetobacter sp. TGL-Y2]
MQSKYKIPFTIAVLAFAITGCSSNKIKVEKVKPNPLPKLAQSMSLAQVVSHKVSATDAEDPLRLKIASEQGVLFILDPKGTVSAFQGKQRLWEKKISKQGLSSGVAAGNGIVVVGNKKGQIFALDQATGAEKWTAQLSGSLISSALVQSNRVIVVANNGTTYGLDDATGQQVWTYKLPGEQFSLRGQASPVSLDPRTVLIASSNAYLYAIDSLSGTLRMQRRVAVSDGRSDIQRLIDIDGEPTVAGQFVVTTSYQGQVTVTDLASQRVVWSEDSSSIQRPEVAGRQVIVSQTDGKVVSYDLLTGQVLWSNDQLLHRNLSNPVVLGQHIVVGDLDGVLHLLEPSTGNIVGRSKSSGEVRNLRVLDNQLYAVTRTGALSIWQNR